MGRLRIDRIASRMGVLRVDGEVAFPRCYVADSFLGRLVGLLGSPDLARDEALLIPDCSAIHTFGMREPIGAAFLDRQWRVGFVSESVRPNRIARPAWAAAVLEYRVGARGLERGRRVSFSWRAAQRGR